MVLPWPLPVCVCSTTNTLRVITMKIMVVGGGGREHAIIRCLKKNPAVETISALPGNGGMEKDAVCTGIGATDLDAIVSFAKENEIDYAVVAWEGDFRFVEGDFTYNNFSGSSWSKINKKIDQDYLKNSYRVLLTRSRQGFVIYVPKGNYEDITRNPAFYDETYEYLKSLGIVEI